MSGPHQVDLHYFLCLEHICFRTAFAYDVSLGSHNGVNTPVPSVTAAGTGTNTGLKAATQLYSGSSFWG